MNFIERFIFKIRPHISFLLILTALMMIVFYPLIDMDFQGWDLMELQYYLNVGNIPPPLTLFSLLKFYLTNQYGSSFALYEIPRLFFGYSATAYHISNGVFRFMAALSLYYIIFRWTNKRIFASVAALFFAIAMPGIESTIWVVQYYSYIAVILLCLCLFFWKKFHDFPTWQNLKLSVLFFAIALFISHIRLPNLPIIILVGEIYYFFRDGSLKIKNRLRFIHVITLLFIFLILFYLTGNMNITTQVFKIVSPDILIKALLNGYPPILHNYFRFISNLILPPDILDKFGNILGINIYLSNPKIVGMFALTVSIIFFIVNLIKKNFLISAASLWAVVYPVSLLSVSKNLNWEAKFLPATLLGGTFFILIVLILYGVRRYDQKDTGIALLGCIIMVTSLIIPWAGFPATEGTIQSAYNPAHRYYIVPLVGISLVWGFLFTYCLESIKASLGFQLKKIGLGLFLALITLFVVLHGLTTYQLLLHQAQGSDKANVEAKWKMVKSYFTNIGDRQTDKVVYVEGDINPVERAYLLNQFDMRLALELKFTGERNARHIGNINTVSFTDDKEKIKQLFSGEILLKENNFFALRFTKDKLVDIKSQVINELKGQK